MRFPTAPSWLHSWGGKTGLPARSRPCRAHRRRLDHQQLRQRPCALLPSARGPVQTESRVGSGSSEGLQGAGAGDHVLAQERVTQSVSSSLAPGVRSVLRFEDSGSACSRPRPAPTPRSRLLSRPPPPSPPKCSVCPRTLLTPGTGIRLSTSKHMLRAGAGGFPKVRAGRHSGAMLSLPQAW